MSTFEQNLEFINNFNTYSAFILSLILPHWLQVSETDFLTKFRLRFFRKIGFRKFRKYSKQGGINGPDSDQRLPGMAEGCPGDLSCGGSNLKQYARVNGYEIFDASLLKPTGNKISQMTWYDLTLGYLGEKTTHTWQGNVTAKKRRAKSLKTDSCVKILTASKRYQNMQCSDQELHYATNNWKKIRTITQNDGPVFKRRNENTCGKKIWEGMHLGTQVAVLPGVELLLPAKSAVHASHL